MASPEINKCPLWKGNNVILNNVLVLKIPSADNNSLRAPLPLNIYYRMRIFAVPFLPALFSNHRY